MQVIQAKYRGRKLISPDSARPTLQRVKQSLFSTIQEYLPEAKCLDLFAGSGSLGIECISRGSEFVTFVEKDSLAVKCIKGNLKNIDTNLYELIEGDYLFALKKLSNMGRKYNVVFLDPPYDSNVYISVVEILERYNLLEVGAIIVVESSIENNLQLNTKSCIIEKEKEYGSLKITILKKEWYGYSR